MKRSYKIITGAAAVLSLALAATVYAHPGGSWGPGQGMGYGMGPGYGMGSGMGPGHGMGPGMGPGMGRGMGPAADMTAAATARTSQLKAELKITPAQEAAWKAYEAAVTQQASAMQAMRTQMQALMQNAPATTAPDWAAQREAMFKQRQAGMQAHTAAVKELYAVLTPEQRAIVDRNMGPMGGYRMGGGNRMR
jgi:Spy/CpxP family protein refolding chaperone